MNILIPRIGTHALGKTDEALDRIIISVQPFCIKVFSAFKKSDAHLGWLHSQIVITLSFVSTLMILGLLFIIYTIFYKYFYFQLI